MGAFLGSDSDSNSAAVARTEPSGRDNHADDGGAELLEGRRRGDGGRRDQRGTVIRHPGPLVRVPLGRGVSEGTLMVEVSAMLQVMRPDQFDVDVQQSLQVGPILVQL